MTTRNVTPIKQEEEIVERFLTADEILATDDLEVRNVYVPEWKSWIRLRVMSADDAVRFQEELNGPRKKFAQVDLLSKCAVDHDGNRMFTPQKLEQLRKKSTAVFMRLQNKLLQLNGFKEADKSLAGVTKILMEAGVSDEAIKKVAELWKDEDEEQLKND